MQFPVLQAAPTQREMLAVFRGYNANPRIGDGEFSAMENMTSDAYPLLSTRRARGEHAAPGNVQGIIAKDSLCWVDGSAFVINGYRVELGLSQREEDCPKQLVPMGAYVVIFPDKKYINTMDVSDSGNLEAEYQAAEPVSFSPCSADGSPLVPAYIQPNAPENPEHMALWLDNSAVPNVLLQWSEGSGMWVDVERTYVRLASPHIGAAFREGDGVTLTGGPDGMAEKAIVVAREENWVVLPGLLEHSMECMGVTLSRKLPRMDFVIECGNRLWGCRYGMNAAGQIVNEIYASKLGDFRNWSCFEGISTDSYIVSLGADGPFTGAIAHMGYPLFFREDCIHKIYGSYPANYRLQTTPCPGVQRGSGGSLAIVGEVLFYKSAHGVCAYDGSLPVTVSQALGLEHYRDAVGGGWGGKYYLSMADSGGQYHLFAYDRARGLWHREDRLQVRGFAPCREELYCWTGDGKILTLGGGTEGAFPWMVQTGDMGLDSPDNKYYSRLTLRLWLEKGARMKLSVRYDGEDLWQPLAELEGRALSSVTLPVRVRRCERMQLKLEGRGQMKLWSIARTVEEGSDVY